jgi:hypothetical protein
MYVAFNPFDFCKGKSLKTAKWQPAPRPFMLEQWQWPAGTMFKAFETRDAGFVSIHPDAPCSNSNTPRRLYRY